MENSDTNYIKIKIKVDKSFNDLCSACCPYADRFYYCQLFKDKIIEHKRVKGCMEADITRAIWHITWLNKYMG